MTRVLGIDPGSFYAGWAVLDVQDRGMGATFRQVGNVDVRPKKIIGLIESVAPELVCIEEPVQAGNGAAVSGLLLSAWTGGGVEYIAEYVGLSVRVMYAHEWRIALTGSASPSDAVIATRLRQFVEGMPANSNCHQRDAVGVAWHGARMPAAMREVRRTQAEMKARARGHKATMTARANRAAKTRANGNAR